MFASFGGTMNDTMPFDRTTFREDAAIQDINDYLAQRSGWIKVLDCGSHDCRLARAMMAARLDIGRIRYFAFDMDETSVNSVRAEMEYGDFKGFRHFDIRQRRITDIADYKTYSFQLIFLNNLLHEVFVEDIPFVLRQLNKLLARPDGKLSIIDMAELPEPESELWAVTWTAKEVKQILEAGGFRPTGSTHLKKVEVCRVVTPPITDEVKTQGIYYALELILNKKKIELITIADRSRARRDTSAQAHNAVCALGVIELTLGRLKGKGIV
jgi:hypothetical protein